MSREQLLVFQKEIVRVEEIRDFPNESPAAIGLEVGCFHLNISETVEDWLGPFKGHQFRSLRIQDQGIVFGKIDARRTQG